MRPGSKHLCGQTCLHKLVDEFMAQDLAARAQRGTAAEGEVEQQAAKTDASLTSGAAYVENKPSARLIAPPMPSLPKQVAPRAELVSMPGRTQEAAEKLGISGEIGGNRPSGAKAGFDSVGFMRGLKPPPPSGSSFSAACQAEAPAPPPPEEPPSFTSRNWRSQAWDRERERERRTVERRPDLTARWRSGS